MPKDKLENEILAGDTIVRAVSTGSHAPVLAIQKVREIKGDSLYLDDSKVPIKYPGRLLRWPTNL